MVVKYAYGEGISVVEIADVGIACYMPNSDDDVIVAFTPVCDKLSCMVLRMSYNDAEAILDELYNAGKIDISDCDVTYVDDIELLQDKKTKAGHGYNTQESDEFMERLLKKLSKSCKPSKLSKAAE